jgi:hypothetical protein
VSAEHIVRGCRSTRGVPRGETPLRSEQITFSTSSIKLLLAREGERSKDTTLESS